MEYRKNMKIPLDRGDEAFLRQMLEENADEVRYGEMYSQRCSRMNHPARNLCGCESTTARSRQAANPETNVVPGCGCSKNRQANEDHHHSPTGCGCGNGRQDVAWAGYPIAMVYSPVQEWREILEADEAMVYGTLFRELIFPWHPAACHEKNNCGCQGGQK